MSDTSLQARDRVYVGGTWAAPSTSRAIEVVNPATEEIMGRVPWGGTADVDGAVAAARRAFPDWAETPVEKRAEALRRMAQGLAARSGELSLLLAEELGTPLSGVLLQVGSPVLVLGAYAELATEFAFEEWARASLVLKEPVGVAACLAAWNYPLLLAVFKIAPALAAGCTVVLKPPEVAPLSAFVLGEVAEEVGLPPGVLNVVSGDGSTGEALVSHPGVDLVSFTGSTSTGRKVAALAGAHLKRTVLELGGKSASVILDDADLADAVGAGVRQCFMNAGQACISWSRMLVPRRLHDQAATIAGEVAESFVVGDPLDPETTLGPLATAGLRHSVGAAVEGAVAQGARLVTGGPEPPEGLDRGFYVKPTVFADVSTDMDVARQEVFGPVLALIPYDGEDEAVRIANDTPYGLHGAVFSTDRERAQRVARRLRTGQVDLGGGFNAWAPWGGYGQSGIGRELGRWGLEEYLEVKSLHLP